MAGSRFPSASARILFFSKNPHGDVIGTLLQVSTTACFRIGNVADLIHDSGMNFFSLVIR